MPSFYMDTSAILKFYINEPGADFLISLLGNPAPNDVIYTSFFSAVEFTSAIMRRVKGREFSETTGREFLIQFDRQMGQKFTVWPLDHHIAIEAISVAEQHKLRAGDAIHFATATQLASTLSDAELFMVSSDKELIEASVSVGMGILNPQSSDALDRLIHMRSTSR